MWKVRKFLTRKPDTKLKSRVFFSMRSNIFSSATWMDPFPIFIPPVKNCFDIVLSLTCSPNVASKIEEVFQYRWIQKIIEKCNEIQNNPTYRPSQTKAKYIYGKVFFYISRKS